MFKYLRDKKKNKCSADPNAIIKRDYMLKAFQIQSITNDQTVGIISDATFTMSKCKTHDAVIVVVVFSFQQILPCYMRQKFGLIDDFWMDIACAVAFWGHLKTKNYSCFFYYFDWFLKI